jgi:tRNA-dihydrouridine synthase A
LLKGLSPKENRTIPPLNYETVFKLKKQHPDWHIVLNGGVKNLDEAKDILQKTDGVMMGRAAYETPWILANADSEIFGVAGTQLSASMLVQVLNEFLPYAETQFKKGVHTNIITRHLTGLFHGMPDAKKYRTILSAHCEPEQGVEKIKSVIDLL